MNKDRLRLWVAALRSGQYEQAVGYLRKGNRYCCLGVLCEVAINNGLELDKFYDGGLNAYYYDSCAKHLPMRARDWIGFTSVPLLQHRGKERTFPELNDSERMSFDAIAAIIEEQLINA